MVEVVQKIKGGGNTTVEGEQGELLVETDLLSSQSKGQRHLKGDTSRLDTGRSPSVPLDLFVLTWLSSRVLYQGVSGGSSLGQGTCTSRI